MNIETNTGRLNLLETTSGTPTFMQDKIPVNVNTNFKNIIKHSQSDTPLSRAFFSKENVMIIQNGIRAGVYDLSQSRYKIDEQNSDTLNVIMHSVYLQYSMNRPQEIPEQITALNKIVLDYCVPKIYLEVRGYMVYKEDVSTLAEPMAPPAMTTNKQNTLELKHFF